MPIETYHTVIPFCDGTRTLGEIAEAMGITQDAVKMRIRKARQATGLALPVVPLSPGGGRPRPEWPSGPGCIRCGLRGEHDCVPGIEHYAGARSDAMEPA